MGYSSTSFLRLPPTTLSTIIGQPQYSPELVPALAHMVASGIYDVALGSRMLGKDALVGGMPRHKFLINKLLTLFQNILLDQRLSEYISSSAAPVIETSPRSQ